MTWNGEGRDLSEPSLTVVFADISSPAYSLHTTMTQEPGPGLFLSLSTLPWPISSIPMIHTSVQVSWIPLLRNSLMVHIHSSLQQRNLKVHISKGTEEAQLCGFRSDWQSSNSYHELKLVIDLTIPPNRQARKSEALLNFSLSLTTHCILSHQFQINTYILLTQPIIVPSLPFSVEPEELLKSYVDVRTPMPRESELNGLAWGSGLVSLKCFLGVLDVQLWVRIIPLSQINC